MTFTEKFRASGNLYRAVIISSRHIRVSALEMNYDSDSSAGDDVQYTTTVLGYASKEPTSDTISHLGGKPVI
jgi:hypothetical protein